MRQDTHRSEVVLALRSELLGPSGPRLEEQEIFSQGSNPQLIDTNKTVVFNEKADSYGVFIDANSKEEILTRTRPTTRYGLGVLYPLGEPMVDPNTETEQLASSLEPSDADNAAGILGPSAASFQANGRGDSDDDDFDLTATSSYRPSAMGLSFLAQFEPGDRLVLKVRGGRYSSFKILVEGHEREWWVRRSIELSGEFGAPDSPGLLPAGELAEFDELELAIQLLARKTEVKDQWLMTAVLVNRADRGSSADSHSLFQATFDVTIVRNGDEVGAIQPYPDRKADAMLRTDPEARSLDLLYRNAPTFAIGHGCAATWNEDWGHSVCKRVVAEPLPSFEAPSTTPDASLPDGTILAVPLAPLAGLDGSSDGFASVQAVVDAYGAWIQSLEVEANYLDGFQSQAAQSHIQKCVEVHRRMQDGLNWLSTDEQARRAFIFANRAVLYQQLRFSDSERAVSLDRTGSPIIDGDPPLTTWQEADRRWRAFQIGFIVASAKSTVVADDPDRETVELIFFPTGGGKTEAYQGLAAFAMFYQRLSGCGAGVNVILRYTLRLLTSQQFVRAAGLVCAMEFIRAEEDLPIDPFSIGIWVGQSTTPITKREATTAFRKLAKGNGDNPFLLLKCPWCSTQMGPVSVDSKADYRIPKVAGYRQVGGSVGFFCPDRSCTFSSGHPIFVVDEDIYERRPSIIVGTIDKFAMLAYRPEARRLFGIGEDGAREVDPPNLIIQDELHLISGPLGSVAGLYEAVIERLCSDDRSGSLVKPKIVASTATIRRYENQVKGLYNRRQVTLFPPHGLDAGDSFFARFARDLNSGQLLQGRLYIGVHAPGLGSMQTVQVRTSASLLQVAADLPSEDRDPWWTLMMFFNSLRELGTSVSLLQSDIPDYLLSMGMRTGIELSKLRRMNEIMELTSRLRQDEISQAIRKLERTSDAQYPVDTCLASNIIEVGVDIPRLSLLVVVGQPKSTSQYIQVTGRVGRNWQSRPGLVVTLYGASKPRDRSHFEHFQSYHQRLYSEVEPVSVTPFALPVLRRALHAAVLVHVRQNGERRLRPEPMPEALFGEAWDILLDRAAEIDPDEVASVERQLALRHAEWDGWEPASWMVSDAESDGLIRRAGSWAPSSTARTSWSTPMSMRDVDAECRGMITNAFAAVEDEELGERGIE